MKNLTKNDVPVVLEALRDWFREEHTIKPSDAAQFYHEQRNDEITKSKEQVEQLQEQLEEHIDALEQAVEAKSSYSDEQGRAVIEDNINSMLSERKRQIDNLELPDSPRDAASTITSFIESFQTMTKKENAVMKHAGNEVNTVFTKLKQLKKTNNDLRQTLDGTYSTVETLERLEDLQESIQDARNHISALEERKQAIDTSTTVDEIEELEQGLEELDDDDRWSDLEEMETRRKNLEKRKTTLANEIVSPFSRLDRGLKKISYQASNGSLDLDQQTRDCIEQLKQQELPDQDLRDTALDKLKQIVQSTDVLDGRYREGFLDALDQLGDVDEKRAELDTVKETLHSLDEKIETFPLKAEKHELEKKKQQLQEKLQEQRNEIESINEKIKKNEGSLQAYRAELEDVLNDALYDDITVKRTQ